MGASRHCLSRCFHRVPSPYLARCHCRGRGRPPVSLLRILPVFCQLHLHRQRHDHKQDHPPGNGPGRGFAAGAAQPLLGSPHVRPQLRTRRVRRARELAAYLSALTRLLGMNGVMARFNRGLCLHPRALIGPGCAGALCIVLLLCLGHGGLWAQLRDLPLL